MSEKEKILTASPIEPSEAEKLDRAVNELKSWAGEYCVDSDCEYGRDMAMGRHSKHCGILTNAIADISEGIRALRASPAHPKLSMDEAA